MSYLLVDTHYEKANDHVKEILFTQRQSKGSFAAGEILILVNPV